MAPTESTNTRPVATLEVVTVNLPALARDADGVPVSDANGEALFDGNGDAA